MTKRELRLLIASDRLTEDELRQLSSAELAEHRRILLRALAGHLAEHLGNERRLLAVQREEGR